MKIYKIKVNGKTYKVELESVEETASEPKAAAPKAAAPVAAAPVAGDGNKVVAPLQGTLTQLKVAVGDKVKKGQTIAIIEAMKLENEVSSQFEGTVSSILINKGTAVSTNDVIMIIK